MTKILVVDDDLLISRAYYDILTDQAYEVAVCANGRDAVDYCRVTPPDLIIMDIHMPEMDGLTACMKIRQLPACQRIPILVISGSLGHTGREECLRSGADEFLVKPIKTNLLLSELKRLLAEY